MHRNQAGFLTLPGAIIIAGALIAVALIWINKPAETPASADPSRPAVATSGIPPVTAADHILGNPNAPIKLVEYSDLSCPFCKMFSPTMNEIMNVYGPTGKVAWVYRHFPLYKPVNGVVLHPNSLQQAEALECAAQLGGNSGFFAFERRWFSIFPEDGGTRNSALDREQIDSVAKEVGLDRVSFNDCMASGRFRQRIEKSYNESLAAGITGTPYTVIITPSGTKIPIVGPQSFAALKTTLDTLITTIGTSTQQN